MEDLDLASERSELERETLVARIRARMGSRLVPYGICHACESEVEGQRLFCDSSCAEDYEFLVRRGAI